MKIFDLMRSPVTTVGRDTTIAEAILTLADRHISAVPVVDNSGRMIGVLSSTDILEAEAAATDSLAREQLFNDTRADDLMTTRPLSIQPDADVREAARQMLYGDVHRLFVVQDGHPVGVISRSDVVRAYAIQRA
jgi:CBS domain-containing protein